MICWKIAFSEKITQSSPHECMISFCYHHIRIVWSFFRNNMYHRQNNPAVENWRCILDVAFFHEHVAARTKWLTFYKWHQSIILTNIGLLLHGIFGTSFNGIRIKIKQVSFKKWIWKCLQNDGYCDELVQERHNSIADALELRPSCSNPSVLAQGHYVKLSDAQEILSLWLQGYMPTVRTHRLLVLALGRPSKVWRLHSRLLWYSVGSFHFNRRVNYEFKCICLINKSEDNYRLCCCDWLYCCWEMVLLTNSS